MFLLAVFAASADLGLVVALGGAGLFGIALLSDRLTRRASERLHSEGVRSFEFAEEVVDSADYFAATGRIGVASAVFGKLVNAQIVGQLDAQRVQAVSASLSKFVRLLIQVSILGIGSILVVRSDITAGAMIACSIIAGRALAPIEQSIGAWHQIQSARQALSTIGRLQAFGVRDRPEFDLPAPTGHVLIERLVYRLPGSSRPLLSSVSAHVGPGQLLAIVGESGSGKTTLCRLLTGLLLPSSGRVVIDGTDIQNWSSRQLQALLGYVPQSVKLQCGSIAENIASFDEQVTDEQIVSAAQLCGGHEMILRLPKGYSTQIGGRGIQLSGGQTQVIALARSLVANPNVLILDEPTAHLDEAAKQRFGLFLKRCVLMQKTVILVTHDHQLARACDMALILRQGGFELKKNNSLSISRVALEEGAA